LAMLVSSYCNGAQ